MKEYIKLKRRIVYRGDVYNDIEGERINVLPRVFDSEYMNGIHDGLKKALSILANDVKDIPGADVVEVRHGEWVLSDHAMSMWNVWVCSECGYRRKEGWFHTETGRKPEAQYCENCMAKMDGGADDAAD